MLFESKVEITTLERDGDGLNPCFTGICSLRNITTSKKEFILKS